MASSRSSDVQGTIARAAALTSSEWRLLIAASFAQVLVSFAVRAMPFGAMRAAVSRMRPVARFVLRGPQDRVIWAIEASGRRLPGMSTCLVKAIVADLALGAPDRPLRLSIGIKRAVDGNLCGQAWIAEEGRILIGGSKDEGYTAVADWDAGAA